DAQPVARATLIGGLVAADAHDPAAVVEFLDGYETRFPDAKDWHATAVERRLVARVALGDFAGADRDLHAFLASAPDAHPRRTLDGVGSAVEKQTAPGDPTRRAAALALARKVYGALVASGGETADRIALADLEMRANDAKSARRLYEEALAKDPTSSEAQRG